MPSPSDHKYETPGVVVVNTVVSESHAECGCALIFTAGKGYTQTAWVVVEETHPFSEITNENIFNPGVFI